MTQALVLANASKRFGATQALDGVSVTFAAGEVHALVGENGAGKSTLLGIVSGLVHPDPPSAMEINGRAVDLGRWSPKAAQAAGVSLVPQEPAVIEPMTVAENIFLGREPRRGPLLDRGGMRRAWLRGRENLHKRYLIHVAGYNLNRVYFENRSFSSMGSS